MWDLLFFTGVFLSIGWVVGYVGYNAGGAFHLLLISAFIALLLCLRRSKAPGNR
ncbi:lmo0937 family membrane protein [Niastella populi]|uniref:lmo0937 family membrane protein n=1 Tax=Niastella populi TaxID=550983 RepID=UPI000D2F1A0D|nr:lmo0937 family membrane protein [Niastella populi]